MIFKKLRTRMIAHIIWIVTIVTIATVVIVSKLGQNTLKKHLEDDARAATNIVENILINTMQYEEPQVLNSLLSELSKLHHIEKIDILDLEGGVIFSSLLGERTPGSEINIAAFVKIPSVTQDLSLSHGDYRAFVRLKKLVNGRNCQKCHGSANNVNGILLVNTSDEISFNMLLSNYLAIGGFSLLIIVLLSYTTSVLFVRSIDKPIQDLRTAMEAIKRGNFSIRLQNTNKDELGQLSQSMNTMAEKLQSAQYMINENHRQELTQAESMAKIGELAAGLAHEIKNPISGIVFAISSMIRDLQPGDPRKEIFDEVLEQANRVEQNLESLLSFARQSRLERFPTDVNDIIKRILLFIRQQSDLKLIRVTYDLDKNLPEIMVDPKQIEQVILNLIINAIQAMPDGGKLTISTRTDFSNNHIEILIKDTGVGISSDLQTKIFEPFYTSKSKGVGLGLTLSRDVILRHEGRIGVSSDFGAGSTFSIKLPIGTLETTFNSL